MMEDFYSRFIGCYMGIISDFLVLKCQKAYLSIWIIVI